jgi:hypothetical protein
LNYILPPPTPFQFHEVYSNQFFQRVHSWTDAAIEIDRVVFLPWTTNETDPYTRRSRNLHVCLKLRARIGNYGGTGKLMGDTFIIGRVLVYIP